MWLAPISVMEGRSFRNAGALVRWKFRYLLVRVMRTERLLGKAVIVR